MTPGSTEALDAYAIAVEARARIDAHERVCSERYLQIAEYQRQSNEARALMHARIDAGFKALYGLLWKAAFGVIVALAGVVLFLAERVIE
jgi:hypothetical protein